MRPARGICAGICTVAVVLALAACKREQRQFGVAPPAATRTRPVTSSTLQPGGRRPATGVKNAYEGNAYALSEGKRLFTWFNCVGCHAHGGGGIGPPLMDHRWIYGSTPENIFASIVEGRPNGMPSFGGKIPDDQVWQLSAYVRSLSGLAPKDAVPGRSDHMSTQQPE